MWKLFNNQQNQSNARHIIIKIASFFLHDINMWYTPFRPDVMTIWVRVVSTYAYPCVQLYAFENMYISRPHHLVQRLASHISPLHYYYCSVSAGQHKVAKALWIHHTNRGLWPRVEVDFEKIWIRTQSTQPKALALFALPLCALEMQRELSESRQHQQDSVARACSRAHSLTCLHGPF